ncbi:MAG TPA: hypothetical protein VHB21_09505 [Minicystis sp.]|nr:hypothetical protein [Minicystis sp.]
MRKLVVALALFAVGSLTAAGCGSTTLCDEALDKAQQCGLQDASLSSSGDACEAIAQCQAKCILDADCGQIEAASMLQQNALTKCLAHCG